jgi:hypothetical protein
MQQLAVRLCLSAPLCANCLLDDSLIEKLVHLPGIQLYQDLHCWLVILLYLRVDCPHQRPPQIGYFEWSSNQTSSWASWNPGRWDSLAHFVYTYMMHIIALPSLMQWEDMPIDGSILLFFLVFLILINLAFIDPRDIWLCLSSTQQLRDFQMYFGPPI